MRAAVARRPARQRSGRLARLGLDSRKWDWLVALAGNPNVGKTTVFNALTGLRQHTGNWPGKTVARAEGAFAHRGKRVKVVDLPGAYSLRAGSVDEEVARDFLLFGKPDVTVAVVDAARLERNLGLVLQVLEITDRVVVCLNLVDEAERHGVVVDPSRLAKELGVPVVPAVARRGEGMDALLDAVAVVASGDARAGPRRPSPVSREIDAAATALQEVVEAECPGLSGARWIAQRLLHADESVAAALRSGAVEGAPGPEGARRVLRAAVRQRWAAGPGLDDATAESRYREAAQVAKTCVRRTGRGPGRAERALDRWLASPATGFPLMLAVLAAVFWITIAGANVPSAMLAALLIGEAHPALVSLGASAGLPWWASGFLFDGVYLATAWVVSVMLPPMAIFFPLFTLLEDFGYLPRVAFNLDSLFRRAGAHGKQALTMAMGFGCNAAGVVAARIIDSPRERLIAVITNNFSLCNGRWPTQILIATIFIGALVPSALAGLVSAGAVVAVAVLGAGFMLGASWALSKTMLKGEASTFSLELPPYRPPRVLQTLYTSVVDRTLIVLGRAVLFAVPAGAVIWLASNISAGGASLAEHAVAGMDPFGVLLGLNGVILLAYVVAIPANEIVVPTILMLTALVLGDAALGAGPGVMFEPDSATEVAGLLEAGGWTVLTGVNLMLFSLLHNPCSTTLYTIYKETGSAKWTAVAALLPLLAGFVVCFLVAQVWRLAAGS